LSDGFAPKCSDGSNLITGGSVAAVAVAWGSLWALLV
jgi:hypothetical protein